MERMSGPPYWLDLEDCRYYISQRVAPDPETRRIWEHNEAEAAIRDARAYLALVEVDNRRLKREAKEREDTAKFEAAKKDAVKRKRREAYAEAAGLMTTRAVKTLTRMKAKNVVEEMRAAGIKPVLDTFNDLVSLYCQAKDFEKAEQLFRGMRSEEIRPSRHTYYRYINGCFRAQKADEARTRSRARARARLVVVVAR